MEREHTTARLPRRRPGVAKITPHVTRFAPPEPELLKRLQAALPAGRILSRPIDRLARASDASMYRIVPEVVVRPRDTSDVRKVFEIARALHQPVTCRAAGTSLSGQSVGKGILVDVSLDWCRFRIEGDGATVWAQPGVVGGLLNRALAPRSRRIGPDPASIDAAMIGGIVANNASGMCCGVAQNSYHTIRGATILLADGSTIDTHGDAPDEIDERLKNRHPRLHAGLLDLKTKVRGDKVLAKRVRHKFTTKNTMGYSLQAFLDFDRPAEILTHLMVGSEGTLGFLADVTLATVADPKKRATALVYFNTLHEAGLAVAPLAEAGGDRARDHGQRFPAVDVRRPGRIPWPSAPTRPRCSSSSRRKPTRRSKPASCGPPAS